jgi:hypothetical protein
MPYKGPNKLNFLCIIVSELLGETSLKNIPALAGGFNSVTKTLPPNVATAIKNARLAGVVPQTIRELRLMIDTYQHHHRRRDVRLAQEAAAARQRAVLEDKEIPEADPDEADPAAARYTINEDLTIGKLWTDILPDDVAIALQSLTGRLAPALKAQPPLCDPLSSCDIKVEKVQYEGYVDSLGFTPPEPPKYDFRRAARSPGKVAWEDLIAIADRFDSMDVQNGRQDTGGRSWYRRLHDESGARTAILLGATSTGLRKVDGLDLVDIKHLIGLPGAGKTTLLFLLAAYMAERGYKTCFLFPSIEGSTAFVERLSLYDVPAALMFGQGETARNKHVINFAAALSPTNNGFGETRNVAPFFSTNCALAGFAADDEAPFPHSVPPCESLLQVVPGQKKHRLHRCALSSVCGRQYSERALTEATIWVGHVLSMDRQVSRLYTEARMRHFELIGRTFDLIVVDECDGAQSTLDGRGTPIMNLAGDSESLWSNLIQDLHGPAARGANAFVGGVTIPTILELTGRFGSATERLVARIMHFTPAFRKQNANILLTSLSILADMFPYPEESKGKGATARDVEEAQRKQNAAREALERLWDIAAKTVAFRVVGARGGDDEDDDEDAFNLPLELAQTAALCDVDVEVVRIFYETLQQALVRWNQDASETAMRSVAAALKSVPVLTTAHDESTFYQYTALLTTVTILVMQHFGLAPHLRLLNSQGLVGDGVVESRPSKDQMAILPEALIGRLSGVRYTVSDEGDVSIAHVGFAGTPRLLMHRMAALGRETGSGPAVLLTSATSMLEKSPSFHVNCGPHYVLQRPNAGDGWKHSKYRFMPLLDPLDSSKFLRFSGEKMSLREQSLKSMVDQLLRGNALSEVEVALRSNNIVDGVGRKAAFIVNSYEQCETLYQHIHANYPAWRGRTRYLVRASVHGTIPENAITASEIETLGSDQAWDLLIFPMSAIGRGVNIVYKFGERLEKAMLGSLFFLTRPHPRADSLQLIQGIVGRASELFDQRVFANRGEALTELKAARRSISGTIKELLRLPLAAQALGEYARPFVADQMVIILQTIGRAMRGDCPAFIYFVDAAWASRSAYGEADTARTSMLVMMQEILQECLTHTDPATRECYENLYQSFATPLSTIEGLKVKQ